MDHRDLLLTAFDDIEGLVRSTLDGIDPALLDVRLDPEANSMSWLLWHLTRVQDHHVAEVADRPQAWGEGGWAEKFGVPFDEATVGYGFSSEQVAQVQVGDPQLLVDYHAQVHGRTAGFLRPLSAQDLDRVVDERFDPPVTLGVRLVSVVGDDLQHVGQAAYLRGLLERR